MDALRNKLDIKKNMTQDDSPNKFQDNNFYLSKKYNTGIEPNLLQKGEEANFYSTEIFNDNNNINNDAINIEVNENTTKKKITKVFTPNIYDKIVSYFKDLAEIDSVVPFCQEKKRKELLLDRGLLLCLKINELMEEYNINADILVSYNKENNLEELIPLLDHNYWMNQKVDRYARTEQRKRIPQERWFMIKDNSFTPNLKKCFALNRGKFFEINNWLKSLDQ
jgi:hypothetical protein